MSALPSWISLELSTSKTTEIGLELVFELVAVNTDSEPHDLNLRGREPTFDIEVFSAKGDLVWRRLHLTLIPAIVLLKTLAPNERLVLEAAWDMTPSHVRGVVPGTYYACGLLLLEDEVWTTGLVSFEVLPACPSSR